MSQFEEIIGTVQWLDEPNGEIIVYRGSSLAAY